jgi:hypothetical protein
MSVPGWWSNDNDRIIKHEVNCYTSLHCWSYSIEYIGGFTLIGLLQVTVKFTCNLRWIILMSSVWTSRYIPVTTRNNAWICDPSVWTSRYIPVTSGPTRESAAFRLPKLWFWTPPLAWMCICCDWCVLSERGLCVGLICRPGEFCRVCLCVCVCVCVFVCVCVSLSVIRCNYKPVHLLWARSKS